jgi:hypothetical protein
MPSEYSTKGPAEDYAETFAEVVSEAYLRNPGDGMYLSDAEDVYNRFIHHDIGMRAIEMLYILFGGHR